MDLYCLSVNITDEIVTTVNHLYFSSVFNINIQVEVWSCLLTLLTLTVILTSSSRIYLLLGRNFLSCF